MPAGGSLFHGMDRRPGLSETLDYPNTSQLQLYIPTFLPGPMQLVRIIEVALYKVAMSIMCNKHQKPYFLLEVEAAVSGPLWHAVVLIYSGLFTSVLPVLMLQLSIIYVA